MFKPVRLFLLGVRRWLVSRRATKFSGYCSSVDYRRVRNDVQRIAVQPGLEFEVFWKTVPGVGHGPACSVLVGGEEILRFDCFGPGDGHLHADFLLLKPGGETRLFLVENEIPAQIERAMFEIRRNLSYYTARSPWPAARAFEADPAQLEPAVRQVREILCGFYERSPKPAVERRAGSPAGY